MEEEAASTLTQHPQTNLDAALDGSLAYKDLTEKAPDMAVHYNRIEGSAEEDQDPWFLRASHPTSPAIYLRQLVCDKGLSPTPVEFAQVVAALRLYAAGANDDIAIKIDNCFKPGRSTADQIRAGQHWFFDGKEQRVRCLYT